MRSWVVLLLALAVALAAAERQSAPEQPSRAGNRRARTLLLALGKKALLLKAPLIIKGAPLLKAAGAAGAVGVAGATSVAGVAGVAGAGAGAATGFTSGNHNSYQTISSGHETYKTPEPIWLKQPVVTYETVKLEPLKVFPVEVKEVKPKPVVQYVPVDVFVQQKGYGHKGYEQVALGDVQQVEYGR